MDNSGNNEENVTDSVQNRILEEPKRPQAFIQEPSHPSHPSPATYSCYHKNCDFHTHNEWEYKSHWHQNHAGVPILYPTKFEIRKYGLKPQGKKWEI